MDDNAGVSFESRRRLSTSASSSSSFSLIWAAVSSTFLRGETAKDAVELLIPLDLDNEDLNDATLATDGVGILPARLDPGETGPEDGGKLRERMLTRIEECMLMLSLLLSASLPGRRSVDGRWWFLEYDGGAGVSRSSRDTSMSI